MTAPGVPFHLVFVYPQLKRLTGAQRLILQLATTLVEEGHTVTLVTHRLAESCRAILAPGVRLVVSGRRVDWTGRHLIDSALEYALGMLLVRLLPRAADGYLFFGPPSLPALALARASGRRPLLSFCYEPPRFAYADRRLIARPLGPLAPLAAAAFALYRPLDRLLMRQADIICANGRFGAEEIRRAYGRPALIIDHGVDLPPASPAAVAAVSARFELGAAPVLLTVNHLHPRKRIELFLQALASLRARRPEVIGVIAGAGADRPRLAAEARRLGLDEAALRWTGYVGERDLAALYRRAAVYVHTGQRETFGLSVLEAATAGTPVVSVDEGGPRDILGGGRLGRLTVPEAEALAAAAEELLADPPAAAALGRQAAAEVGARFQWSAGAGALVEAVTALQSGLPGDEAARPPARRVHS